MIVLPAIDVLGGHVVRLKQGDYDQVTQYEDDPVAQALLFADAGAQWLHVVDLDGARTGTPHNIDLVEEIIAATGMSVEVGGGIRDASTVQRLLDAGAARCVIGTKLITDQTFAQEVFGAFPGQIVAGVDAHEGEVAIEGWRAGSGVSATELVAELAAWGCSHIVYTDIAKDGMQTGVDVRSYREIAHAAGFPVIASGGVATKEDIAALAELGDTIVEGVITGRALYEGAFTIQEALAAAKQPG